MRKLLIAAIIGAAGLVPILIETDPHAQAIIPTAISIGYGIIFATVITLFLVPSLYMLQEDGFARVRAIRTWMAGPQAAAESADKRST